MTFMKFFLRKHYPEVHKYFYNPDKIEIVKWTAKDMRFEHELSGRIFIGRNVYGYANAPWYVTGKYVLVREHKQEEISPGTFDTIRSITYYPESIFTSQKPYEIVDYYVTGNRTVRWILGYYRNLKTRIRGEWDHNGFGVVEFLTQAGKLEQKSQMNLYRRHGFSRIWDNNGKHSFKFYIDQEDHTQAVSAELGYNIEEVDEMPESDRAFIKLKYMDCI